ncbi:50S ribosomal protein L24 [Patescibacteria group bacterium]|nr:50S ribosomal protein L24 [Patescibacteria group bacterium]
MNIKKNDKVKILAGKDKGKSGKVLQVSRKDERLSIEGLNLLIKHLRPNREGEKGQRIEFPAFINASNVALICSKCGKTTRVSHKIVKSENGKNKKFRICKKCGESID